MYKSPHPAALEKFLIFLDKDSVPKSVIIIICILCRTVGSIGIDHTQITHIIRVFRNIGCLS